MLSMSLTEAAGKIPCSERWLADNLRAGKFPGHKIARQWRLTENDLVAILDICQVRQDAPGTSACPTTVRRLRRN